MQIVETKSKRSKVSKVRKLIQSADNTLGSVHFIKREDGSLRKMSYRLHVRRPGYAPKPEGKNTRKLFNKKHDQLTVLDVNKVLYNKKGNISGRGAWRTIPLDRVVRVCVKGEIYKIR